MKIIEILYQKLSGIRLTIALCILLALFSLVGTLIPQNRTVAEYSDAYGTQGSKIVMKTGLDDVYHSFGFILLLCLLSTNLIACSGKRFPGVWRASRREHPVPSDRKFKSWKYRERFELTDAPEGMEDRLEEVVSEAFGKKAKKKLEDAGEQVFCIEWNRYARLGPYIAHLGILIILLGGMVGIFLGFKGNLTLQEGHEASTVWLRKDGRSLPLGFRIRCNRFVLSHYADGSPKEYRSDVSVLDDEGKTIMDRAIRVNHPLSYKGITFYQATYGKVLEATLRIRIPENDQETVVKTQLNRPFLLPGDQKDRAMVVGFEENLRIPAEMMRVSGFSRKNLGPAVRLVTFEGYRSDYYTGLQVARDPGTPLVWIGCTLLVVGFLIAFLLDHEVLWVSGKRQEPGKVMIYLAGRAIRHPAVYAGRFGKRKARLREQLTPWLRREG
jgi:cytochrome c biogenesis protein